VHPGKPLTALENREVKAQQIDSREIGEQDIGGWIMMPPSHWDIIRRKLKKRKPE